jgi:DNA (cytosine-5)-methyltransferase 1
MTLKMLSLFSGIGGMDLSASWVKQPDGSPAFQTIAFCEIASFCQKVLRKNFGKDVVIFDDIRTLTVESLCSRGISPESVSVVAGGFPCQDVAHVGAKAGIGGERSGLWREMFRVVCEIRPRYVVVENVAGLLHRGLDRVLADLAEARFDAEWGVLSACAVGAPHTRERVFVVAYPDGQRQEARGLFGNGNVCAQAQRGSSTGEIHTPALSVGGYRGEAFAREPAIPRVADGIPFRVDRNQAIGNAVMPQQVYPIFEAIANLGGLKPPSP